jgi:DNA polymerase elongation subunit (family B)
LTFIAAYHERSRDKVLVWERGESGKRTLKEWKAPHYFYVPEFNGEFKAITGESVKKLTFPDMAEFSEAVLCYPKKFESDLPCLDKILIDHYAGSKNPVMNVGFVDIEVDYSPEIGFAGPANPYAIINAITVYRTFDKKYMTWAIPPDDSWWSPEFQEIRDTLAADDYLLCKSEHDLLTVFLNYIEDVDVLSGWNSEFFDIPYLGKRIELILGAHAMRRLAFDHGPMPRWGERDRFKNSKEKDIVLELGSRVHLDYLRLFRKFNLEGRQSFALNNIAKDELDTNKIEYDGSLAELYKNDFLKFMEYNRYDVGILVQIDAKFKYIELANGMCHESPATFDAIFGTVHITDNALISFCHKNFKMVVFDKPHREKDYVEGALVVTPTPGLYQYVGACDINSLYPSTYRSLNLSNEMIIGQLLGEEADWKKVYDAVLKPDNEFLRTNITIKFLPEGNTDYAELAVGDFIDLLNDQRWALSAFGTVLDQSRGEGLIPAILTFWFKGRKVMQAKKKELAKLAKQLFDEGKIEESLKAQEESDYYDILQGVRKVQLNSLYGATLSPHMRFFDNRLGASTTGTGRQITTHMINTTSRNLLGDDAPLLKKVTTIDKKGDVSNDYTIEMRNDLGIITGDTDSVYFTVAGFSTSIEEAVMAADAVNEAINESFPGFMSSAFFCQPEFNSLIKSNRELVATRGIFRAKKKYMLKVGDFEGELIPDDHKKELKTMGSDIKVSSTPRAIRDFLKEITLKILRGAPKSEIDTIVMKMRESFSEDPNVNILDFATVMSVKNFEDYLFKYERVERPGLGRVNLPMNVRSTFNHNFFIKDHGIQNETEIKSGNKIKIVWLKENPEGFTSFAFPSETTKIPEWFSKHFEIDKKLTEQKLIDTKVGNIFDPIQWEVPTLHTVKVNQLFSF